MGGSVSGASGLTARLDHLSPEERREAEERIARVARAFEENPLHRFHFCPVPCGLPGCKPHPKSHRFLLGKAQIKAYFGGNQSGKTTTGLADDVIQAVDEEWLPERLKPYKKFEPPFYCRIITPDFTGTMEGVVFEKLRELIPPASLVDGSWEKAYSKQRRRLQFANGSWFDFMTSEQDEDKFGGVTVHRVHFDEEPPGEKGRRIWNQAGVRVMKKDGDRLLTMTPENGISWAFDAIYERRAEDKFTVVTVDMDDNPHLTDRQRTDALDGLTKEEVEAKKKGRFVHFKGLVFPEFDREKHVVDPVGAEHLKGQTVLVGIDPGLNYAGALWVAFDEENAGLVFDEVFLKDTDIERMTEAIFAKNQDLGLDPDYYVIDPSSRNRGLVGDMERAEAEFYRFGLTAIVRGDNDHETGAFQIKRRLQADPPSLLVAENCQEFIRELLRARKADTPDGTFKLLKESNPNARNELVDCARYVLTNRPWMWIPERDHKRGRWNSGFAPSFEELEAMAPESSPPLGVLS